VHLEGGAGAGAQGEGPPGRQGHQGDHLRGRRRQRNSIATPFLPFFFAAHDERMSTADRLGSLTNAGREDRLQRVRGYDEEREPRAEPQETARRRPIGDRGWS
jgi:hypothetical protein